MKKLIALLLALTLTTALGACGAKESGTTQTPANTGTTETTDNGAAESTDTGENTELQTVKVAATPVPHAEILNACVDLMAEKGYQLEITEYNDYIIPNTAVEEGEEDANFFQHTPYLEEFNEANGTHLVSVASIHYEPMGIYPGKSDSIDAVPDGGTVAVPNDVTNEARALQLLAAQGLIEVDPNAGLNATPKDITSNPKNLQFSELEAAMLPNTVEEFDLNVINSNFAMAAGLNPATDALASEGADSEGAQTYANVLVVKEGNEDNEAIKALIECLTSDEVRAFIEETYGGAVVPVF